MDKEAASRIQRAEAKRHGGGDEKGSFASRAQSTADGGSKHLMGKEAASRIQSAEAKQHGGGIEKGSHASRAQSTADKRENQKN